MMSLWSLLPLRGKMRRYALLDSAGLCRAFRECRAAPSQPGWVQVREFCVSWLGQPLPNDALVLPERQLSRPRPLLAA